MLAVGVKYERSLLLRANVDHSIYLAPMNPARLAVSPALFCTVIAGDATEPSRSITFEGVLVGGEFYGPHSYGESPRGDRIEHSLLLQLPARPTTQLPAW
jgi:hypothetical protein